jgi:hypothetical protein
VNPCALMLIALIGAHLFLDYAGQGDFMARAKNVDAPLPGVPPWTILWSHAAIHGAAVALITGLPWLASIPTKPSTSGANSRGSPLRWFSHDPPLRTHRRAV